MSSPSSGCAKFAAFVTIIAALIAIFVFLTGKNSLPEVVAPRASEKSGAVQVPTQQVAQAVEPTRVPTKPPTDIPLPEPSPTFAVPPTPSPVPDTPPGSILQPGETWRQGGLELKLTKYEIMKGHSDQGGFLWLHFDITNTGAPQRLVRYGSDNFSAIDNHNRRLTTGGIDWTNDPYANLTCHPSTTTMDTDEYTQLHIFPCDEAGQYDGVGVDFDISDTALTEIIFQATGISSLNNARWAIPINH